MKVQISYASSEREKAFILMEFTRLILPNARERRTDRPPHLCFYRTSDSPDQSPQSMKVNS